MQFELSNKEFRRLLDLVYIGNWVLNSTRGEDRFGDYDQIENKLFGLCANGPMQALTEYYEGLWYPSRAYAEGGIHEAIAYYEDYVFFQILAEELAKRDMEYPPITEENYNELTERMERYMQEFEVSGIDRLQLED